MEDSMEEMCCCESSIERLAADILIARISIPGLGIHPSIEKICEEYEAIYRTIHRLVRETDAESASAKRE
jgi:hypothetical protein